jgi:hypothetical protein
MSDRYMKTLDVYAQPPNRPAERVLIGHITDTRMPDASDYWRWGIEPDTVVRARAHRMNGLWQITIVVSQLPKGPPNVSSFILRR